MTTRQRRPSVHLLAAGTVLALVSLALPWQNARLGTGFYSTYLPGSCTISWDGYSYCETSAVGFGSTNVLLKATSGFTAPVRVVAVLAALLLVVAWRRKSTSAALIATGLVGLGLFTSGTFATSGHLLFLSAAATLAAAFPVARSAARRTLRPLTDIVFSQSHPAQAGQFAQEQENQTCP